MSWRLEVAVMAVIVALVELVLHWFPWRLALRRDLSRVAAYVLGVLGLFSPLSILLLLWAYGDLNCSPGEALQRALIALWSSVFAGGLAVLAAYGLDRVADRMTLATEQSEVLELRDGEVPSRAIDEG